VLLTAPVGQRKDATRPSSLRESSNPEASTRRTNGERVISRRIPEPMLAGERDME
jgi:hypothetical protein